MDKKHKSKLRKLIKRLKNTREDQWCVDIVRTKDDKANCLFGHLFAIYKDNKRANYLWDWFENCISTDFMIYPINDGKNKDYQQATPKARCLAYLDDILHDKKLTTAESMERSWAEFKLEESNGI